MNLSLALEGGHHVGPLFILRKRRSVACPAGKEGAVYNAKIKRATPRWADLMNIRVVYLRAKSYTIFEKQLYVVDHIVPLKSDIVCGLHVASNLRVVPWRENAQKSNRYWPDMPMEQASLF